MHCCLLDSQSLSQKGSNNTTPADKPITSAKDDYILATKVPCGKEDNRFNPQISIQ
jgi:hypothetical protein